MADVGSALPVYRGAWVDQAYLRGDLVLYSGALYQAINNTASQPAGTADISGKGNPASWVNVTALVLDFTGSTDPTAGAGIPSAISSTYHYAGTGLYVKTGSGATAWDAAGGNASFPDEWTVGENGSLNVDFGVSASLLHGESGAQVRLTAVDAGVAGNDITIETVPAALDPNVPLTIDVAGSAITVNVATNGVPAQTSTNANVVSAINLDGAASALVVAVAVGTDTLWLDAGTESLAGGIDPVALTIDDLGYSVSGPSGAGAAAVVTAQITPSEAEYNASVRVVSTNGGQATIQVSGQTPDGEGATLNGMGYLDMYTVDGTKAITSWDSDGSVLRFALLPAGQVMTGVVTAPDDGDLSASQVAFWFDATDGAAKLKIKGKSADGTVVTGTVNLA